MLLESILDGSHTAKIIVVHESSTVKSEALILKLLRNESANGRSDLINVVCFQHPPTFFSKELSQNRKVLLHDGYSDPLGWNSNLNCSSINVETDLVDHIKNASKELLKKSEVKTTVVIDGLSLLLRHKSVQDVCRMIKSFSNLQNKVEVVQIIATIQKDVVPQTAINALCFIADTSIDLDVQQKKGRRANRGSQTEQFTFEADVTLKKKSGKLLREVAVYSVSKDLNFKKLTETEIGRNIEDSMNQIDPTANLPFNLKLSVSEKQARSQVRLPYTLDHEQKAVQLDRSSGNGQIIYHPDDADDFDEEDPDDDLDI